MKLTIFKGIAHDLSDTLNFECFSGIFDSNYPDIPFPVQRDVLKEKDKLDKYCIKFIKERAPKSFNFTRIKHIKLSIIRSGPDVSTAVEIKVDDRKFLQEHGMKP